MLDDKPQLLSLIISPNHKFPNLNPDTSHNPKNNTSSNVNLDIYPNPINNTNRNVNPYRNPNHNYNPKSFKC